MDQTRPGLPFPVVESIPGWTQPEPPDRYDKGGLYGYINGGAELFLQYGFRAASVHRFGPNERSGDTAPATSLLPEKEITLELYLMESPESAFGIFSMKRDGGEPVSPRIPALNWTGPTQLSFVRGSFFINVLGEGTSEKDLIGLAAVVAAGIEGEATPHIPELAWLPTENRLPGSERYIRGEIAASNESPLLAAEFWGFGDGPTRAFSAKYGRVNARVVIIDFDRPREDLSRQVLALFQEYLTNVRLENGLVSSVNAAGYHFLFRHSGSRAALVMGEPDPPTAHRLLDHALRPGFGMRNSRGGNAASGGSS